MEIHFQPSECGNCGAFFVWEPVKEEWEPSCHCADLPVDPQRNVDAAKVEE